METRKRFFDWLKTQTNPTVLELGTRGWNDQPPKHNQAAVLEANPAAKWIGSDMLEGPGVELVLNVCDMSRFSPGTFDAVISSWTFEHIARPWEAACEIARVLKIGGGVLTETHQTFPLHDYPSDYFRFSVPALKELFHPSLGMEVVHAEYLLPSKITPLTNDQEHKNICDSWDYEHASYLVVAAYFKKVSG